MTRLFEPPLLESSLLRSRLGCVAVALLLLLGAWIRVRNLEIPTGRSPDETNYTAQANRLLREGSAGLRGIADEYLRDPAARLAGPPTRAGYLWSLAGTMLVTGKTDETAGAILSCGASIASLMLLTLVGIRFLPPWATIFALLFFAVSPAEQELARRAWGDALVGLLGLAVVYSAAEIIYDSRRRVWHVLFVLLGCAGIVVKEFGAVIFALCAIGVLCVVAIRRRQWGDGLLLILGGLLGSLACLIWLASAAGGWTNLMQIVADWRGAHIANQYALEFQSGPPSLLLKAFYVISPPAALLSLATLWIVPLTLCNDSGVLNPEKRRKIAAAAFMMAFGLAFLVLAMLLPNWLNLRYLSATFGIWYLAAGFGFCYLSCAALRLLSSTAQRVAMALIVAGVAVAAFSDFHRFSRIFVNDGVGDLSVKLIVDRADMFAAEKRVVRMQTAENYLDLCRRYEQNWRYRDAVAACQNAVKQRPDWAEAYDQMAVAYVDMEQWRLAAAAASKALELNPALPRARANLERANREAVAVVGH